MVPTFYYTLLDSHYPQEGADLEIIEKQFNCEFWFQDILSHLQPKGIGMFEKYVY